MPIEEISSRRDWGKKHGVSAMGKETWVRVMASREWRRVRKASGRKRVLKSRRRSGITDTGYRVQGTACRVREPPRLSCGQWRSVALLLVGRETGRPTGTTIFCLIAAAG